MKVIPALALHRPYCLLGSLILSLTLMPVLPPCSFDRGRRQGILLWRGRQALYRPLLDSR